MSKKIILSGCSGGGKSTLLAELVRRGYDTVPEPGRRVVAEGILPWQDMTGFACRCLVVAQADYVTATGFTFFDRSVLDALIWFQRSGTPLPKRFAGLADTMRYDRQIFLTPPWPEIYAQDDARKHGYNEALEEYHALCDRLPKLGYQIAVIPRTSVIDRADWIEAQIRR